MQKVEAKTVGKTLCNEKAEEVVYTVPNTISELVAKTIADTLSCVQAKAPVKTESPLLFKSGLTQLSSHLTKLKLRHCLYAGLQIFTSEAESVTVTLV